MAKFACHARTATAIALAIALPALCAGCWDSVDIDRRKFFSVFGIDPPEEPLENAPGGGLLVSVLASVPAGAQSTAVGAGGGASVGGGQSSAESPPLMKAEGKYVEEAFMDMRSDMSGVLDTSTVEYLVVGKDISPEALTSAIGTWMFTVRAPITFRVLTTDERAVELLEAKLSPGDTFQGAIDTMRVQSPLGYGFIHHMPELWRVMSTLTNGDGDLILPIMNTDPENKTLTSPGVAVYDGARRVGRLTRQESGLACWVAARQCQGGVRFFPYEGRELIARLRRVTADVKAKRGADGMPEFTIKMDAWAELLDSGNFRTPLIGREVLDRVELALADNMRTELLALTRKLQSVNSDALRLYAAARLVMRDMSWNEFKDIYPSVKVHVEIKVRVRRVGLLR
jgi:hypothetical protein